MEDRNNAALYLELGNRPVQEVERRADRLARQPGAERVSWWENCHPGRTDLRAHAAADDELTPATARARRCAAVLVVECARRDRDADLIVAKYLHHPGANHAAGLQNNIGGRALRGDG